MRFIIFVLLCVSLPLHASTLQEAMTRAYTSNPTLKKEQARLRAVDEGVPLAKSGQRPSVDLTANAGYNTLSRNNAQTDTKPRGFGLTLTQPIYKGGRIEAEIDAAEKTVLAARADYQKAEQDLFLEVATVYLNMWRDQSVLKLNRKNEQVLAQELKAAKDRLNVGEATRTDVAQAESRYSGSVAARIEAEGNLAASRAAYMRVVGEEPQDLSTPKIEIGLPEGLEAAIRTAMDKNPKVIAARFSSEAADHEVDVASGALLPEVNIEASAGKNWDTSAAFPQETDTTAVAARLTMPLYRSGADYARTRAAKEQASQKRVEIHDAADRAREEAVRAWESLQTSKATLKARRLQVNAANLAYEGVKQESEVGTRTILDRLDAEAEALQARVELVRAERDEALAMFSLKAAVGGLTAQQLALPVTLYLPEEHYEKTKDVWIGTAVDFEEPVLTPFEAAPVAAPSEQQNEVEDNIVPLAKKTAPKKASSKPAKQKRVTPEATPPADSAEKAAP